MVRASRKSGSAVGDGRPARGYRLDIGVDGVHATRGIRPTEEEARRAAFLDVEESDAGSVRLTAIM